MPNNEEQVVWLLATLACGLLDLPSDPNKALLMAGDDSNSHWLRRGARDPRASKVEHKPHSYATRTVC